MCAPSRLPFCLPVPLQTGTVDSLILNAYPPFHALPSMQQIHEGGELHSECNCVALNQCLNSVQFLYQIHEGGEQPLRWAGLWLGCCGWAAAVRPYLRELDAAACQIHLMPCVHQVALPLRTLFPALPADAPACARLPVCARQPRARLTPRAARLARRRTRLLQRTVTRTPRAAARATPRRRWRERMWMARCVLFCLLLAGPEVGSFLNGWDRHAERWWRGSVWMARCVWVFASPCRLVFGRACSLECCGACQLLQRAGLCLTWPAIPVLPPPPSW